MKLLNDINTEEGRKRRENHSEKMKEYFNPDTEQGRFHLEENRRRGVKRFNPETEEGRKRREKQSQSAKAKFDINTEDGIKRRKEKSEIQRNNWDKNTERGRKLREHLSEKSIERFNPETEEGRKRRENHSKKMKLLNDINTEEGRKRREHMFNKRKEQTKEQLQKRKDASILGELMFDEDFIKENFLIIDDKNNLRFLWSVYSKLTGYSESHIAKEKREGKLSFLHGIKSISITEELENSKIKEIEAIIKSRNEKRITNT